MSLPPNPMSHLAGPIHAVIRPFAHGMKEWPRQKHRRDSYARVLAMGLERAAREAVPARQSPATDQE